MVDKHMSLWTERQLRCGARPQAVSHSAQWMTSDHLAWTPQLIGVITIWVDTINIFITSIYNIVTKHITILGTQLNKHAVYSAWDDIKNRFNNLVGNLIGTSCPTSDTNHNSHPSMTYWNHLKPMYVAWCQHAQTYSIATCFRDNPLSLLLKHTTLPKWWTRWSIFVLGCP